MKKKNYAALAVALVTGGMAAEARAGLYSPTAVQNGDFSYDLNYRTPNYTYNSDLAGWYHVTGNEYNVHSGWLPQSAAPISGAPNNAYAFIGGDGTNTGEIFQSIGTYTPNMSVSISLLEAYITGDSGQHVIVSLYSGGSGNTATPIYSSGYGTPFNNNQLTGATLLGTPQSIADQGLNQFSSSSFTLNTGTSGTVGSTLWLDIKTDDTSGSSQLALDEVTATASTVYNPVTWTGSVSNTWDSATANFSNTSGGVAFVNGADAIFNNIASTKSTITLSGTLMPGSITFNNSTNSYTVTGSGTIAGGTSLTKLGTGALSIATSNSFTGPVTVNAGSLILQNGAALGTSQNVVVASGAMIGLQTSSGSPSYYNNFQISGSGISNQGALVNLSGTNTVVGSLDVIGSGTIGVPAGTLNYASSIFSDSGLTVTGSSAGLFIMNSFNFIFGDFTLSGTNLLDHTYDAFRGTNLNISNGTLTSDALDGIRTTNVNVFSGGILVLASSYNVDDAPNLNIEPGGKVSVSAANGIGDGEGSFGGIVSNVNIVGGTFDISGAGANGYITAWNLTGGTMSSTGGGAYNMYVNNGMNSGAATVTSNANVSTSVISGPVVINNSLGDGTLVITTASGAANGIDLNISGSISGPGTSYIDKEGPGTLALTGSNTFTGPVTIGGGTLMIGDGTVGHDGALNSSVQLQLNNNALVAFNTYSSQSFGGSINGNGNLTKMGPGNLVLTGPISHSGFTNISGGTLYLNSSLGSGTGVAVLSGGSLGGIGSVNELVTVLPGGGIEGGQAGTGQLSLNSGLTYNGSGTFLVGSLPNYATTPALSTSSLTTTGAGSITIKIGSLAGVTLGTSYELLSYAGGSSGTIGGTGYSAFTLGALPSRGIGSITNNTSTGQIDLTITGTNYLIWTGTGTPGNTWNTLTSNLSWKLSSSSGSAYYIDNPGDTVVFDDSASSANTTVNLNTTVHPFSVTFNNSSNNYVLQGTGAIAGSTGLTLTGTASVALETSNTFTGATLVNSGTLQLGNGTTGHDGSINSSSGITLNGTLSVDNVAATMIGAPITIGSTGVFATSGPGAVTLNSIVGNAGNLNISGGGATTLGGAITGAGNITINTPASVTISGPIGITGKVNLNSSTGVTINSAITNAANVIVSGSGSVTSSVGIGGATVVTMNGTGTLTLNGANDFTGVAVAHGNPTVAIVNSGTMVINSESLADPVYVVGQGGTLELGYNSGGGYTGEIVLNGNGLASTAGLYIKSGVTFQTNAGIVIQTAPTTISTYGGSGTATLQGFDINTGDFIKTAANASGSVVSSSINVSLGSYGYNVGAVAGANTSTGDLTIAGNIFGSGSYGLTKLDGNGSVRLTGTNTYTSGTNIKAGSIIFASPAAFPAFTAMQVSSGAVAVAANHGTGPKNNLFVTSLSLAGSTGAWTGLVDVTNNDMIVRGGSLADTTHQVGEGYNGGAWNGSGGITSSAAAANTTHLTALGVVQAGTITSFDGQTVTSADILVKYTYYGDPNLDGKVDGSDYSVVDSAYLFNENPANSSTPMTGWQNGDFNYDNVIDGSDYTLLDNTFNQQGAVISTQVASPTAQISGVTAVPEPATLGILSMGAIGLLGRRKRR